METMMKAAELSLNTLLAESYSKTYKYTTSFDAPGGGSPGGPACRTIILTDVNEEVEADAICPSHTYSKCSTGQNFRARTLNN